MKKLLLIAILLSGCSTIQPVVNTPAVVVTPPVVVMPPVKVDTLGVNTITGDTLHPIVTVDAIVIHHNDYDTSAYSRHPEWYTQVCYSDTSGNMILDTLKIDTLK